MCVCDDGCVGRASVCATFQFINGHWRCGISVMGGGGWGMKGWWWPNKKRQMLVHDAGNNRVVGV